MKKEIFRFLKKKPSAVEYKYGTTGSISLLNCEIYQRGRVSRVDDTELTLMITQLIRPAGSIPSVEWVGHNQTNKQRAQFRTPLKLLGIIVLWCLKGNRGPVIGTPWCRDTLVDRTSVPLFGSFCSKNLKNQNWKPVKKNGQKESVPPPIWNTRQEGIWR